MPTSVTISHNRSFLPVVPVGRRDRPTEPAHVLVTSTPEGDETKPTEKRPRSGAPTALGAVGRATGPLGREG